MYIQYTVEQLCLPMDLEDDIPQNYLVRSVNAAVNRLDDAIFASAYTKPSASIPPAKSLKPFGRT